MKVVFDPRAVEDLERIHDFIAADSPVNADAVVDRILSSIDKLGEFPSMARVGQVEGTREWVIPRLPYIAVYKVDADRRILTILAVFHGAQDRDAK
jgi:addiction module RelE/StbE family toxin